ncbi:MAG: hypothetical protein ACR2N5_06610 [Solirubrobacterales bacterium]
MGLDVGRLGRGELIAGISGVLLFIFMFFSWFGVPDFAGEVLDQAQDLGVAIDVDTTANAWQAFDFIDLVLLLAVIISVGFAIISAAGSNANLPVAGGALTAGIGIIATLLVLYRIIDPPSDAGRELGVWLGLITSAGIAVGGWMSMQEEGGGSTGLGAPDSSS